MDKTETPNSSNDGYIWASRAARVVALLFAVALAVANWLPQAVPIEWEF